MVKIIIITIFFLLFNGSYRIITYFPCTLCISKSMVNPSGSPNMLLRTLLNLSALFPNATKNKPLVDGPRARPLSDTTYGRGWRMNSVLVPSSGDIIRARFTWHLSSRRASVSLYTLSRPIMFSEMGWELSFKGTLSKVKNWTNAKVPPSGSIWFSLTGVGGIRTSLQRYHKKKQNSYIGRGVRVRG